ncbi:MAG: histidine phosphotransferase family protein [Alphaproteobacteria bacterium]
MTQSIDLRIFQLLTARLCHDLVGPVGAASNGAELLNELGGEEGGDVVELIADSTLKATNRLRYYRVAYGLADGVVNTAEDARGLAAAMFSDQRFSLDWPPEPSGLPTGPARLVDAAGKLLLNMLLLAAEAMGREGSLTVKVEIGAGGTRLDILAHGPDVALDPETLAGLSAGASLEALTPRSVQGYFTARLAEFRGAALLVEPLDQAVRLTCTLASDPPA